MIKAVFIDVDDTILNSERKITDRTKDAIKKCKEKGIKIIIASGRSRNSTLKLQKEFGTSPYLISSNGASVYDIENNREIHNNAINKSTVYKILEHAFENGYKLQLQYKDKEILNEAYYEDEKDKIRTYDELKSTIEKQEIVQCVISSKDFEKMQNLKKIIKEFKDVKITNQAKRLINPKLPPRKIYYCDLTSIEATKGSAVSAMIKYLNLRNDEVVVIGDGENDISMFKITQNSVAMENATDKVKSEAKYETDSNDNNGVAKVLEKI